MNNGYEYMVLTEMLHENYGLPVSYSYSTLSPERIRCIKWHLDNGSILDDELYYVVSHISRLEYPTFERIITEDIMNYLVGMKFETLKDVTSKIYYMVHRGNVDSRYYAYLCDDVSSIAFKVLLAGHELYNVLPELYEWTTLDSHVLDPYKAYLRFLCKNTYITHPSTNVFTRHSTVHEWIMEICYRYKLTYSLELVDYLANTTSEQDTIKVLTLLCHMEDFSLYFKMGYESSDLREIIDTNFTLLDVYTELPEFIFTIQADNRYIPHYEM